MELKTKPFSIKLLYWITEVSYWFYIAIMLIVFALVIRSFIGEFPKTLNLQVDAPFTFNISETGNLITEKGSSEVMIKEATGKRQGQSERCKAQSEGDEKNTQIQNQDVARKDGDGAKNKMIQIKKHGNKKSVSRIY